MELEEYFRWKGVDVSGAIRVDGRYRGCGRRESDTAAWPGQLSFLGTFPGCGYVGHRLQGPPRT